jgi:hypothetical protein
MSASTYPTSRTAGLRRGTTPGTTPCAACRDGRGLHSCEDFPLSRWTESYLCHFDAHLGVTAAPRFHRSPDGTLYGTDEPLSALPMIRPSTLAERSAAARRLAAWGWGR